MAEEKKPSLTREEEEGVWGWLSERIGVLECPACGRTKVWSLGDVVARVIGDERLSGWGYPAVVLVCTNCAHMMLFKAPRRFEWVRVGRLAALLTCRRRLGVTFDTLHAQHR